MQTRKKIVARTAREHASPRFSRQQKKVAVFAEKKVTELITSSAKKQKYAGVHSKKTGDAEATKNLSTNYIFARDESQGIHVANETYLDHKRSDERAAECVLETIFSPTFHIHKDVCSGIPDEVDFKDFFRSKDLEENQDHAVEESKADTLCAEHNSIENRTEVTSTYACNMSTDLLSRSSEASNLQTGDSHMPHTESHPAKSSCDEEYNVVGNLSSEVSAIYLAMQHSKLECIDELSQDSTSPEGCVDPDEDDEFDDFDPYVFIKNLPELSAVVPTFRPMLLPKQTRSCPSTTLVLDLDETLVHSSLEPCGDADFTFPVNFNLTEHTVYVRCRPYLKDFMERVASLFEIIIFTASQSIYAEQLLNVLDPKRRLFRHRVYRESCVFVEGNYLKDLSVLGRDLAHVIIIDNSPQAFGYQVDNGIPIESWFDDRTDQALPSLLPFLESLVGVEDVRPVIAKRFNLREKIAGAACFSVHL